MARLTPHSWTSAAAWILVVLAALVLFAWWSGAFVWPPEVPQEAREDIGVGGEPPPAE